MTDIKKERIERDDSYSLVVDISFNSKEDLERIMDTLWHVMTDRKEEVAERGLAVDAGKLQVIVPPTGGDTPGYMSLTYYYPDDVMRGVDYKAGMVH